MAFIENKVKNLTERVKGMEKGILNYPHFASSVGLQHVWTTIGPQHSTSSQCSLYTKRASIEYTQ